MKYDDDVRFKFLKAASMKIRDFWKVAPCSLGADRRFRGAYCLHHYSDDDGAVRTSETSVYSNDITWRNISERSNLYGGII
jgi:hypothetical protein